MDFPYPSRALSINFLTLAAVPTAVGCSRQLVRLGLNRWGLSRLIADAELVVSELTTNAVQATGLMDTDAKWSDLGNLATIHVRLLLFETSIAIEVWDRDPAPPAPQEVAGEEEGGRGLSIVAALSTNWSYFLAPQGGKVVSAELPISRHPLNDADLPQRSRAQCGDRRSPRPASVRRAQHDYADLAGQSRCARAAGKGRMSFMSLIAILPVNSFRPFPMKIVGCRGFRTPDIEPGAGVVAAG
jgi:anti-sigma regulatory factor (Ser/Thr protein kinase)